MFFTLLEQQANVSWIVSDIVIHFQEEQGLNIYHITFFYQSKFNLASALSAQKIASNVSNSGRSTHTSPQSSVPEFHLSLNKVAVSSIRTESTKGSKENEWYVMSHG